MELSKQMITEIERSIEECEKQTEVAGSYDLYCRLVAKFSVIDTDFTKGLPKNGKIATRNNEFDYRPEIKAIKEKLKMMLLHSFRNDFSIETQRIHDEIQDLIRAGENALSEEYYRGDDSVFDPDRVDGPKYEMWALDIETFSERYLKSHPLFKKITLNNDERHKGVPQYVRNIINCLVSISRDQVFLAELEMQQSSSLNKGTNIIINREIKDKSTNKIFLVHGHDEAMKLSVARTLEKANLVPIILHEQPNEGLTIIQKFEKHADVAFAIVLYSPCDLGRSKTEKIEDEKPRARQNVVFEHGYLNGRLGRNKVCALLKDKVEKPSDIDGVLYIPMDDSGAWKSKLAQEMDTAGLTFDLKALIY